MHLRWRGYEASLGACQDAVRFHVFEKQDLARKHEIFFCIYTQGVTTTDVENLMASHRNTWFSASICESLPNLPGDCCMIITP